jgi:dTDP-4-amino-4,6-dideoxygalactose transaminase
MRAGGIPRLLKNDPQGLHESPVFKGRLSQNSKAFPETGKACEEVLSIPVHPLVRRGDIGRIVREIRAFF